jgi:hypothetical protein
MGKKLVKVAGKRLSAEEKKEKLNQVSVLVKRGFSVKGACEKVGITPVQKQNWTVSLAGSFEAPKFKVVVLDDKKDLIALLSNSKITANTRIIAALEHLQG